ncbi:MAG TPA: AAA family ATPase, partial [Gemmatimonadaceae bacterium]|nr:AAA family ATPase [Gemmatimonadaceae bacterium]
MSPLSLDPAAPRVHIVALRNVRAQSLRWLWPGYLPLGKLVVLDGHPGLGKSTLLLDIAARLSQGRAMPDGSVGYQADAAAPTPADTVILTYEDDVADTLRPRLEAAGGDVDRVHHVAGVTHVGDDQLLPASLPVDLEGLENALARYPQARLLVIDPLATALSGAVHSSNEQSIRRVLARLARLAVARDVCIVAVRHVRKSAGRNSIAAGTGSVGIIGHARVGLLVERHPEDQNRSVLAVIKSNVGPIAPSLVFARVAARIQGEEGAAIETSRLEWTGTSDLSADALLAARQTGAANEVDGAAEWLRDLLASGARLTRGQVAAAAAAAGFKMRTVDRAADRLGVRKEREGFGGAMRSFWTLGDSSS